MSLRQKALFVLEAVRTGERTRASFGFTRVNAVTQLNHAARGHVVAWAPRPKRHPRHKRGATS